MIKQAKKRGYVTYEQLNAVMPSEEVTSEKIEDVLAIMNEMGIDVVETEGGEPRRRKRTSRRRKTSESGELVEVAPKAVAKTEAKEPTERTDDPVRMYLREMGSVELLSREGEIAIAKRIEAGREAMIAGLCESPLTFQARPRSSWRDELNKAKSSCATSSISKRPMRAPTPSRWRRPVRARWPAACAGLRPRRGPAPAAAAASGGAAVGCPPPRPRWPAPRADGARQPVTARPARKRRLPIRSRRGRSRELNVARRDRGRAQAKVLEASTTSPTPSSAAPPGKLDIQGKLHNETLSPAQERNRRGSRKRSSEKSNPTPQSARMVQVVEQLYDSTSHLVGHEGRLMWLCRRPRQRVVREDFLRNYQGSELTGAGSTASRNLSAQGLEEIPSPATRTASRSCAPTSTRSASEPGSRSASSARSSTWCRREASAKARQAKKEMVEANLRLGHLDRQEIRHQPRRWTIPRSDPGRKHRALTSVDKSSNTAAATSSRPYRDGGRRTEDDHPLDADQARTIRIPVGLRSRPSTRSACTRLRARSLFTEIGHGRCRGIPGRKLGMPAGEGGAGSGTRQEPCRPNFDPRRTGDPPRRFHRRTRTPSCRSTPPSNRTCATPPRGFWPRSRRAKSGVLRIRFGIG